MRRSNAKWGGAARTARPVAPEHALRRDGHATDLWGVFASSPFVPGAPTTGDTVSYRVHCNWCGKQLFREDMAVLDITVERRAAASRRERDWAQEKRPTLHFCVGENLDTNRMGMSDMRVDDPDSCFTRAIAAVNGRKTEQPNMGLEWRLMPVPDSPQKTVPDAPQTAATRANSTETREQVDERIARRSKAADGTDGIRRLGLLPDECFWLLWRVDVLTVSELQKVEADNALRAIPGIGPKREEIIRAALKRYAQLREQV